MRPFVFIHLIFLPIVAAAQGDFSLLKHELRSSFSRKDTVMIFGSIDDHYGSYVLFTEGKSIFLKIEQREGKYIKYFDSSAICTNCKTIVDFAKENYRKLDSNFTNSIQLWTHPRVEDGKIITSDVSQEGFCYFLGLYSSKDFTYSFFSKRKDINYIFDRGGYYYWVYFNLQKNHWGNATEKLGR